MGQGTAQAEQERVVIDLTRKPKAERDPNTSAASPGTEAARDAGIEDLRSTSVAPSAVESSMAGRVVPNPNLKSLNNAIAIANELSEKLVQGLTPQQRIGVIADVVGGHVQEGSRYTLTQLIASLQDNAQLVPDGNLKYRYNERLQNGGTAIAETNNREIALAIAAGRMAYDIQLSGISIDTGSIASMLTVADRASKAGESAGTVLANYKKHLDPALHPFLDTAVKVLTPTAGRTVSAPAPDHERHDEQSHDRPSGRTTIGWRPFNGGFYKEKH